MKKSKKIIFLCMLNFSLFTISKSALFNRLQDMMKKNNENSSQNINQVELYQTTTTNTLEDLAIKEKEEEIKKLDESLRRPYDSVTLRRLMSSYKKSMKEYIELIKNDEEKVFFTADLYFRERKYEMAAQIFSSNQSSARNLFGAATSYRFLGENQKAIDFYNVTISLEPRMALAYQGMGLAYKNLKDYDNAIRNLQTYLSIQPSEDGYLALGDIYLAKNMKNNAVRTLSTGLKLYPQSNGIRKLLRQVNSN